MTYADQLKIEQVNKDIINNIINNTGQEEFIEFYKQHNRKETCAKYGLRNDKQLVKILKLFNYDFSFKKALNKGKPATRDHESYVVAGKKSAETQKQHWAEKSDREKTEWALKQKKAHNTDSFKAAIKQINIDYQAGLTAEQKAERNAKKAETCKKTWTVNHDEILMKAYVTRKENNSFNSSSPEDLYYNYLISVYGKEAVYRNYNKDVRYPFACDFYVVPKDLFIELNLHWSHGGHAFDETNITDIKKFNIWQKKAEQSAFYKKAIETWTIRDPLKIKIANENNLNYIVYYNESELYND